MLPSGDHWFTKPESLKSLLKTNRSDVDFQIYPDDSVPVACGRIVRSLSSRQIAVPAAVIPSNHWVAIAGVATRDVSGTTELCGLYFNDPYPNEGLNIHPHAERDECGNGECFGVAFAYATAFGWQQMHWAPNAPPFFTVCEDVDARAAPVALAPGFPQHRPGDFSQVKACAELGIAHEELVNPGAPLASILSRAKLGAVSPVAGQSYYSVDLINQQGVATGVVLVDMSTGALLQVQAFQHTATTDSCRFSISIDARSTLDRIQQSYGAGFDLLAPPDLYWLPSAQAASPFHPLVRIRMIDQDGMARTIYVRDDGIVLEGLTAFGYDAASRGLLEFSLI
jgi:hypothetical protein